VACNEIAGIGAPILDNGIGSDAATTDASIGPETSTPVPDATVLDSPAGMDGRSDAPIADTSIPDSSVDATPDAGSDGAVKDSEPADSRGPAPTVTLVTPNLGSSAGGWAVTVTGSNFASGATIAIAGHACTQVTWKSATTLTALAPAYVTMDGASMAQTVTVTNPDLGSGSGSGVAASYFYLPSNRPILMFERADVGVTTGASVAGWADQSGNGNHWSQAAVTSQPALGANYNATGLPYLVFNGSTDYMTNTFATAIPSGLATMFLVGNAVTLQGVNGVPFFLGGSAANDLYLQIGASVWAGDALTAIPSTVPADTNPHVFGVIGNGGSSVIQVDSVATTGSLAAGNLSGTNGLGADQRGGPGYFTPMNILLVMVVNGVMSPADLATTQSILKQTSNTP
jgi:hypothetical protein